MLHVQEGPQEGFDWKHPSLSVYGGGMHACATQTSHRVSGVHREGGARGGQCAVRGPGARALGVNSKSANSDDDVTPTSPTFTQPLAVGVFVVPSGTPGYNSTATMPARMKEWIRTPQRLQSGPTPQGPRTQGTPCLRAAS